MFVACEGMRECEAESCHLMASFGEAEPEAALNLTLYWGPNWGLNWRNWDPYWNGKADLDPNWRLKVPHSKEPSCPACLICCGYLALAETVVTGRRVRPVPWR